MGLFPKDRYIVTIVTIIWTSETFPLLVNLEAVH
jgi:hypothetical protein